MHAAQAGLLSLLVCAVALANGAVTVEYSWVYRNPNTSSLESTMTGDALLYSHMGMLNVLPNSSLAALWQAAPVFWEGSKLQGIYMATSEDYGKTWSGAHQAVSPMNSLPIWAPVLHVQASVAWLFFSESRKPCWWWGEGGLHYACGGDLKVQVSSDSGLTWSAAKVVYSFDVEGGIAKMVSNKVALGPSHKWLLPFWREMGGHDCTHAPGMHGLPGVLMSQDQGGAWSIANISRDADSAPTWLIENAIAGTQKGWVQLFRTTAGAIYISHSSDGQVWGNASASELPNPNSKVDVLALDERTLLVAFNDALDSRSFLTLATSCDNGNAWTRVAVLEDDPEGSFSYPTLQNLPAQDLVLVIYSVDYLPSHVNRMSDLPPNSPLQDNSRKGGRVDVNQMNSCLRKAYNIINYVISLVGGFAARCSMAWLSCSERADAVRTSKQQHANAWGRISEGMKLARVSRSELLTAARCPG